MSSPHVVNDHAVDAKDVHRRFGNVRALRGLDLRVAPSTSLVLFGPNGAGKTTLLKLLAGLTTPDRGRVCLFGSALPASTALRRRIGVVGHDSLLYDNLSARENLSYYARLYGIIDGDRIDAMISRVGMSAAAERAVGSFSRGMTQRLALARALLHEPDLLLLDEPFTGLDPSGRELLAKILREEHARGTTLLMTTHDFQEGLAVADQCAVVHEGKLAWHSSSTPPDAAGMAAIYADVTSTR